MTAPWMALAEADIGLKEGEGALNNTKIQEMFALVGHPADTPDSVAWCAAATGSWLKRAGCAIPPPEVNLMARSYLAYGTKLTEPKVGAIAVLVRGKPPFGHVGLIESINRDKGTITLISGNVANKVSRETRKVEDVLGYRWPVADGAKPDPVKPVLPTAAASKSAWAQVNAMLLVVLGYLTDLLQQGWEWAVWAVGALPVVVSGASPSINSGMQIAEWLGINWSKVAISTAVACMGVVLIRHIQDKRRVPWD